jgi:hypothetical protein
VNGRRDATGARQLLGLRWEIEVWMGGDFDLEDSSETVVGMFTLAQWRKPPHFFVKQQIARKEHEWQVDGHP